MTEENFENETLLEEGKAERPTTGGKGPKSMAFYYDQMMKREELEKLADIVPTYLLDKIQLPIIVQRRFDLGKSIYTVMGNKLEEFTLKKALEIADHNFNDYEEEEPFHIFKPYLSELIRKFHTLIVIGFGKQEALSEL